MKTIDSVKLCRAIGVTTGRVDQLIHRGVFSIKSKPGTGKTRKYTLIEAMNLLVLLDLMELGLEAREAWKHISGWVLFNDEDAFLVLSTGKLLEIIQTTERGAATSNEGDGRAVYVPGKIQSEIVKKSDLVEFLSNRRRHAAAVINLQARFEVIEAIFEKHGE